MALFMDVHNNIPDDVTTKEVADAHRADLRTQERFGVRYINHWLDESAGKIFCLVEAPDAEAATRCHQEAHGLVADEIYPVLQG